MKNSIHILLVEDTPSDVRLTKEALKDCGINHELSVVNDGEEAMQFLRTSAKTAHQPDLIFLDINMPRKNGHAVLAELQHIESLRNVPVVLLTASRDEDDIQRALGVKLNFYLAKPITSERINTLIAALLHTMTDLESRSSSGEEAHVRYVIAGNPHTSQNMLGKLALDRNPKIRMRVAENAQTPPNVLEKLLVDTEPEVRAAIAENPNAAVHLLERLARDLNRDVRLTVASQPRLPHALLRQLSIDENGYVMSAAQKTLDNLEEESAIKAKKA